MYRVEVLPPIVPQIRLDGRIGWPVADFGVCTGGLCRYTAAFALSGGSMSMAIGKKRRFFGLTVGPASVFVVVDSASGSGAS